MTAAGFSATWLRQREPFDLDARRAAAAALDLPAWLAGLRPPGGLPWQVVDLACGTGANLRVLAPLLAGPQHWVAIDHDPALLSAWPPAPQVAGLRVEHRLLDLQHELDRVPLAGATLVTASALLDLVGAAWLQRLVGACRDAGAALLFALSVDGRHDWAPADPDDAAVGALFRAHQGRDKGFGAALGPRAPEAAAAALQAAGYRVRAAASDWRLDAASDAAARALLFALVDGIAEAAVEQDGSAAARVRAWQARRRALAPRTTLRVGHVDLLASLPIAHGPIGG